MINYLEGRVKYIKNDHICLLVDKVGYKIEVVSSRVYKEEEELAMYISTVVREDSIRLFGFNSREELELFDQLTTVSGVGPKIALAILEIGVEKIIDSILDDNLSEIKIKGVGSKTLEKITIELNGKLKLVANNENRKTTGERSVSYEKLDEVTDALLNLGFNKHEIEIAKSKLTTEEKQLESREIIKIVLKNLRLK